MSAINLNIIKNLSNLPGWQTKRKFLVFESDDWGSIRMPSKEVFERLIAEGTDLTSDEGSRYNKYDTLANKEDMESLFELLTSIQDSSGRNAVFTPVSVVANPDFVKIRQSDFTEYHYEPFTETLKRYAGCENSFKLWQEGIRSKIFVPQFHGREHLNVRAWLRALNTRHAKTILAFNNNMWGLSTSEDPNIKIELQAAFDFVDPDDISYQIEIIKTGLDLFETIFGYRATFFVPPNGPFSSKLENTCTEKGIKYLSTSKIQSEPMGYGRMKRRIHWIGQKSKSGLIYLTRNCFFEPSQPGKDWIDSCLREISTAFRWNKPAVISTHRVNYIGALHKENRDNGLRQLKTLLNKIMNTWPETEFVTSAELGEIICND